MNNIDLQYKNITAVLTKELAVYETIIDLFRQKQDCILKGNIDNLKSIVEEIQSSSALAKKYQTLTYLAFQIYQHISLVY